MSKKALVRRPGSRLSEGIVTHRPRVPVGLSRAMQQWERYVEALEHDGWQTIEVPCANDCPDSVFVEDTCALYRNVAVIARPGVEVRRPETVDVEKELEALGCSLNRIRPPGTLDGGDVLVVGDVVYVGSGGRTTTDGVGQLRAIVEPLGARVVEVGLRGVLHLKSAVTALPDGRLVGDPGAVDDPSVFPDLVLAREPSGAQVVALRGNRVLMAADCPRTAGLLAELGYDPVVVDIGEFQKLEGGVTCLSVRLRELYE